MPSSTQQHQTPASSSSHPHLAPAVPYLAAADSLISTAHEATALSMDLDYTQQQHQQQDNCTGGSSGSSSSDGAGSDSDGSSSSGSSLCVTLADVQMAETRVRPSALREVEVEVPNVRWEDVGGMEDIKRSLKVCLAVAVNVSQPLTLSGQ